MTNYATKMLDWGDPNIGFQQQRGQHGESVTVTHNLVRFLPLPDGALEINFGNTVHFCGGSVVHRSDGEILLSAEQRRELAAVLAGADAARLGIAPIGWIKSSELEFCRPRGVSVNMWLKPHEHLDVALYGAPARKLHQADKCDCCKDIRAAEAIHGDGPYAAPQQPAAQQAAPTWLPMETAPKDGTMLRLLVEFEDHATEDSADPCPTIGANNFDNDEQDEWKFAGWNWSHDCFTEGIGKPVGWMPLLGAAPATAGIVEDADLRLAICDIPLPVYGSNSFQHGFVSCKEAVLDLLTKRATLAAQQAKGGGDA